MTTSKIHKQQLLKALIPTCELIEIFLEEVVLISPYESLMRGWVGQQVQRLRLADIISVTCSYELLRHWFATADQLGLYDEIEVLMGRSSHQKLETVSGYEYIYCGEAHDFLACGVAAAELAHWLYSACELGQVLSQNPLASPVKELQPAVMHDSVPRGILCCFSSSKKSLSAALQLRQEGYWAQAMRPPIFGDH